MRKNARIDDRNDDVSGAGGDIPRRRQIDAPGRFKIMPLLRIHRIVRDPLHLKAEIHLCNRHIRVRAQSCRNGARIAVRHAPG